MKNFGFLARSSRPGGPVNKSTRKRMALVMSLLLALVASLLCAPFYAIAHAERNNVRPQRSAVRQRARLAAANATDLSPVPAQQTNVKKEGAGAHGFIIEMVNGVATCRDATPAEIPSVFPPKGVHGTPVRELLKPDFQEQLTAGGQNSSTGLTINFIAMDQLAADADKATVIAAFQTAAAVWTSRIKSPVTLTVLIDYGPNGPDGKPFGTNILGSTGSGSVGVDYPTARDRLVTTASGPIESSIYNSLPTGVVPTDVGNGSVVSIPSSLSQSLGIVALNPDDIVASISFNSTFDFDFDSTDGITAGQTDFVAVATHELGHALGFVSNDGEGESTPLALLDLFRFRPGTTSLTMGQRIMSIGGQQVYFTGQTFSVGGAATNELGFSTGGPDGKATGGDGAQSSHWKHALSSSSYIGIMDPSIGSGVHQVTTENDFSAMETMGWNLVDSTPPPLPPPPPPNDNFSNAQVISGCSGSVNGTNLSATAEAGERDHLNAADGPASRSVWYQWQSPSTGDVTITTAGSGFDTILAVYTGSSVSALTLIKNNDDIPDVTGQPHQTTSSVTFPATAGTTYRIAVDGFNNGGSGGDMGPIKLNWSATNCSESIINFAAPGTSLFEGDGNVIIVVTRSTPASIACSVDYATTDGYATAADGDYTPTSGRLNFAPGETTKNIIVPIIDDGKIELDETFSLTLSNPSFAVLGGVNTFSITIVNDDSGPSSIQLASSSISPAVTESQVSQAVTITRTGDLSLPATVDYATGDTAGATPCNVPNTGKASSHCDYIATLGTLTFAPRETSKDIFIPIVDDAYLEGNESFTLTLTNPKGSNASLGTATTTVTINDNESGSSGTNQISNSSYFVREQYIDFLNREPDASGLAFWTNEIDGCTPKPQCTDVKRINVSAAFFLSIEFKETGFLVYKTYQAAFNTHEFLRLQDFLADTQAIGRGVIIGQPGANAPLEANKQKFFLDFVQRAKFLDATAFPVTMPAAQFVDKLNANTFDPRNPGAGALTQAERDNLVALLSINPAAPWVRAQVLRTIAENAVFSTRHSNQAFVLMQYFGYLRRNPNDPPEPNLDYGGYNFWLSKLVQFNGNFVQAEMVNAFITSTEYHDRFGP